MYYTKGHLPTEEAMREYLGEAWYRATGLEDYDFPLTSAIIEECLETTEPEYAYKKIAKALRTIADTCRGFANQIEEEAEV